MAGPLFVDDLLKARHSVLVTGGSTKLSQPTNHVHITPTRSETACPHVNCGCATRSKKKVFALMERKIVRRGFSDSEKVQNQHL